MAGVMICCGTSCSSSLGVKRSRFDKPLRSSDGHDLASRRAAFWNSQSRPVAPDTGERHAVLLDGGAGAVVAFLARLLEFLPVAQADGGHGRLDQIVGLFAYDPALRFRSHRARPHQNGDDGRMSLHAILDQPTPGPLAIILFPTLEID